MSEVAKFFQNQQGNLANSLNTSAIGEIVRVDLQLMQADVQLLEAEESLLMSVPIGAQQAGGFIIRPPYKEGDRVVVVFSKEDTQPFLYGGGDPSELQHDKDNAMIVCGISDYLTMLPSGFAEHENDLVLAHKSLSAKIVITETGEINLTAVKINMNSG